MSRKIEKLEENEYLKFYKSLHDARIVNKHGCYVSLDYPENYRCHDNYLLDDGVAGFSIVNGDLVGLHKNPILAKEKGYNHVSDELIIVALKEGAVKLDCYGDFLSSMYMQYGFFPTGYVKFNKEYNLDWDIDVHGTPDVFAFFRIIKDVDELFKLMVDNNLCKFSEIKHCIPKYNDYCTLLADRDKIYAEITNRKLNYSQAVEFIESFGKDMEQVE